LLSMCVSLRTLAVRSFEVGDATQEADIVRILADISKRAAGTLDVLVNNAGSSSGFGLVSAERSRTTRPHMTDGRRLPAPVHSAARVTRVTRGAGHGAHPFAF
jgi:NAD(P)-dependent dehydrogenase (short-subunit alcohol dehydrogenase family)